MHIVKSRILDFGLLIAAAIVLVLVHGHLVWL